MPSPMSECRGRLEHRVRVQPSASAKRSGRCVPAVAGSGTGNPMCPDPRRLHYVPADMTAASTIWMSGG